LTARRQSAYSYRMNETSGATRCSGAAGARFVTALLVLLPISTLFGSATALAQAPVPSPAPPAAIPAVEVAARAAEVSTLLRAMSEEMAASGDIETIRKQLPDLRNRIDFELAALASILHGQPTLRMLQANEEIWRRRQLRANEWLDLLTRRATLLQDALDRLASVRATWRRTRESAETSAAPGLLLQQIDTVIEAIDRTRTAFDADRSALLDLQADVAREAARCASVLAQLAQAQHTAMEGILVRDGDPIWSADLRARAATAWPMQVGALAARRLDIATYLRDPSLGLPLHIGILAVMTVVLLSARRRAHEWNTAGDDGSPATAVFDRPYAAALAVVLFVASIPGTAAPPTVREVFRVLALVPVIRLTQPVVDRRLVPHLYLLAILYAVDNVRQDLAGAPMIEQAILTLELLAGIGVLAYVLNAGALNRTVALQTAQLRGLRTAAGFVLLVLTVALVAGSLGYMRLARLLTSGVLGSGALAVAMSAGVRIILGLAAFVLRLWPLRLLRVVQHHRDGLERRIRVTVICLGVGAWLIRSLDNVGLWQPAVSLGQVVLATNLGRGSIQISVGNILEFFFTVWLAYLVSAFIRVVLNEDVYPRTRLTRGLSYAISSLLNYVIIALGFVLALGILGLDLTRLTVLAGAFGVGIGFGLQSVVNNFVCGLILLFERPLHVGDIVEIGDLSGEVSRIGIRASTLRTWQGAEIIVPNAQLVTERVTNWTHSDRTRRIDLPVGVDYRSAPDAVVQVLEEVARAHPEIMKSPAPVAVFKAFGDSSINFELRAWTNRFERWPIVQTELAVAVYAALQAAGMSIPFPQREVRVLHDGPSARDGSPPPTAGDR